MTARQPVLLIVALALLLASCGGSEDTTTSSGIAGDTTTTSPAATTTPDATTTTTPAGATTTTTVPDTTTSSTLAGVPVDFFPQNGDVLYVVGVAHDDVLNVRAAPGVFNDVVATVDPTGSTTALGVARDLGRAIWIQHDPGAATGWSNAFYLAFMGATDDATNIVIDALGERPTAASMEELGLIVARSQASTEEPESLIVMSEAPGVGDIGEVAFDVVGFGDDAVYAVRLHVFGEPVEDGFSLRNVERTVFCSRGVDDNELCV